MTNIFEKLTTNIILNSEKLNVFPLRLGAKQRYPSHHSISTSHWKSLNAVSQEKKTKSIQIDKEDIKLSLFTDDTIIYVNYLEKNS